MSLCTFAWVQPRADSAHYLHHCVERDGHDGEHQCFCDEREVS